MLEKIFGSKAAMQKAWPEIAPLVNTFQMDLVAQAYKNLSDGGVVPTKEMLQRLGDISLVIGKTFPDVATAVAAATKGDLIKIAGRRASLAGLNLLLSDLPGWVDGVFYQPATGAATERLVLIHAGPALDRASTEAWLRERMDPVFLPRTVIRVDQLPRAANGKLPRSALDAVYNAWLAGKAPR